MRTTRYLTSYLTWYLTSYLTWYLTRRQAVEYGRHMSVIENRFPADREANREYLLAAVDAISETLIANRHKTEEMRTLAPESVAALRESGLFMLKAPREVGGAEAHPVVQMDVIEAMAQADPAASWCMLISSAVAGMSLARLPDEAVEEVLDGGFPFMAGSLRPGGSATKVAGGYRVTGRWAWGSGVPHADWVSVPVFCDDPGPVVSAVVPIDQVTLHDTWHVMGMKGTGSGDYELNDVFVPDHFVSNIATPHRRGGALYRLGMPGYVINEHGCFAYAIGRLALQTAIDTAVEKKRGYVGGISVADRQVFQRAIGQGTQRMNACHLLMADAVEKLFESAADGPPSPSAQAAARSAAVWCTDEALDVVASLFRYAGGSAVKLDNIMQRCLRDLYTVQSHLVVSDSAYEKHGQLLLGLSDQAPLR
ncbi:MAG: acyl-CoA dehydrogenase family protein [Acidimicrobiales bacterium]